MPIKLPKGFPRRKSSNNALEEVPNPPQPPQPSFRVFERPASRGKSFDGGHYMKFLSQNRPVSTDLYAGEKSYENGRPTVGLSPNNNRGSGGTHNSASSGGLYDTSSSSPRYSSSSTLPSSSSIEYHTDDSSHAHPTSSKPLPLPPPPTAQPGYSIRSSDRTYSIERKVVHEMDAAQPGQRSGGDISTPQTNNFYTNLPELGRITRPRALTETSGSTATPPKLLDTELDFAVSDGFENMFEGFDSERKQIMRSPETVSPSDNGGINALGKGEINPNNLQEDQARSSTSPSPYLINRSPYTPPPPLRLERTSQALASPYSNDSRTSLDGLMAPSPQQDEHTVRYYDNYDLTNRQRISMIRKTPSPGLNSPNHQARQPLIGSSLKRNSTYNEYRKSPSMEESASLLATESAPTNRATDKEPGTIRIIPTQAPNKLEQSNGPPGPYRALNMYPEDPSRVLQKPVSAQGLDRLQDGSSSSNRTAAEYMPAPTRAAPQIKKPEPGEKEDALLYDPSFRAMAQSAERFQSGKSSPPRKPMAGRVMTPAQFERYRKEQELYQSRSNASKSDSEDSDGYEDDDEERTKELVKQRRKQEAHLSVYRQQMMKVTGERAPTLVLPPNNSSGVDRLSTSAPSLATRRSFTSLASKKPVAEGKGSDASDEDVPLGILAAHGFPSKQRPPNLAGRPTSNIHYSSETYPPPSQSIAGSVAGTGQRGPLPPFARNLPKDPYYGASIVNHSNRESLAFSNSRAGSTYGGTQASSLHPGGLVGVIASEERSRALRRGSPSGVGGQYGLPGSGLPLPPSMSPPVMPALSPAEQAQLQMSQQMNQMMQMQMQWMQQMQQMMSQGLQPGQQPLPMPNMMQPPNLNTPSGLAVPSMPIQRPVSMAGIPLAPPQQQRAMSMLSPDPNQWSRSNRTSTLGPIPNFAPHLNGYVSSIAPSERSTVGQPSRYRPVSIAPADETPRKGSQSRASTMGSAIALNGWNGTASGNGQTVRKVQKGKEDDDDDEAGWEEMKKKRDAVKAKSKKKGALDGVFYPVT